MSHFFGSNLKAIRDRQGYTQEIMARELGITRSRLASYELGSSDPGLATFIDITKKLNLDVDVMLRVDMRTAPESALRQYFLFNDDAALVNLLPKPGGAQ